MSRGMWKAVETSAGKIRIGEADVRRSEGGSREKERGEREGEKQKKGKPVEVSKIAEEWEIWDEEEEAAKSEAEARKLVPEKFHR